MNQLYLDTARLLTQVAPFVFVDGIFALKGGSAINLFVRDMPRLSVDLDLIFPDHKPPRDQALQRINEAIRQSADRLNKRGFLFPGQQAAGRVFRRRQFIPGDFSHQFALVQGREDEKSQHQSNG